ncbi:MAG: GNAT family N-acetyltransferase [Anaerolineae bacterium]|nr:GNAT family N-acetyltransferase [Anaerolineae bacterium]
MTDMLVKLYALPPLAPALERPAAAGIAVRRALVPERHHVLPWVAGQSWARWASECEAAYARLPVACFVAVREGRLLGFACYDATYKGVFGPMGVLETERGTGVGAALLLACLHDMSAQGYAYAVIGWTGPQEFYTKVCGAAPIPGSRPGMYAGMLSDPQ